MAKKTTQDLVLFDALLDIVLASSDAQEKQEAWHAHIRDQVAPLVASGASYAAVRHRLDQLLALAT